MTDELRTDEPQEQEPRKSFRMKMGTDYRFHFEDEELRRKSGDTAEFDWIETTFLEDFIV